MMRIIVSSSATVDRQLLKLFAEEARDKPVHVVPQGFFPAATGPATTSGQIRFVNKFADWCAYIPDYRLDEISYVVYPSVDRPHKNTLTLLRAIELLLRQRQMNIKFVSTSYTQSPEVRAFIIGKRLFLDALYTPTLDAAALDSLIAHAQLVVHPSLAEGGDVFNFSRAVAAGVPALLADIPVTREMFDRWHVPEATYRPWLFDATDPEALADLIARSIADRAGIAARQREVHLQLAKYDYTAMASRYYEIYAFTTIAVGTAASPSRRALAGQVE